MTKRPPLYFYDFNIMLLAYIQDGRLYNRSGEAVARVNSRLEVFEGKEEIGHFQRYSTIPLPPGCLKVLYQFVPLEEDEPLSPTFPLEPMTKFWASEIPPSRRNELISRVN